jgi:acetoacetyl-CoA reductase
MQKRVALVTGGNGGIGTEICKALHAQGRHVVTTCMNPEREGVVQWQRDLAEQGVEVHWVQCDVSDFDACQGMARQVASQHGSVEVLINVAGITRDNFLHKMPVEDWDAVMRVNLGSAFNVTRQFVEGMRQNGFGRIVNIASVNGQTGQFGQTNYSASKAGLHGFTMALAREGARKNVTVNTVSPGYVQTSMMETIPREVLEQIVAQVPAGRLALPEEIARVVAFLAADESGYITGANLPVNGGYFMSF